MQVTQKISLPSNIDDLSLILDKYYKMYDNVEFYVKGSHINSEIDEESDFDARIIISCDYSFLIHGNPWGDVKNSSYFASYSSTSTQYHFYVHKEYRENYNKKEFLWVRGREIDSMEMRYTPKNNKDAVIALKKYNDED